jgi:hypothetical protein
MTSLLAGFIRAVSKQPTYFETESRLETTPLLGSRGPLHLIVAKNSGKGSGKEEGPPNGISMSAVLCLENENLSKIDSIIRLYVVRRDGARRLSGMSISCCFPVASGLRRPFHNVPPAG